MSLTEIGMLVGAAGFLASYLWGQIMILRRLSRLEDAVYQIKRNGDGAGNNRADDSDTQ